MNHLSQLHTKIGRIWSDEVSPQTLCQQLSARSVLARVNAAQALAARSDTDADTVAALRTAAADRRNQTVLLGTVTAADVMIASLLRLGHDDVTETARRLIDAQPEPHRSDLLWYLRSEGLIVEPAVPAGSS